MSQILHSPWNSLREKRNETLWEELQHFQCNQQFLDHQGKLESFIQKKFFRLKTQQRVGFEVLKSEFLKSNIKNYLSLKVFKELFKYSMDLEF